MQQVKMVQPLLEVPPPPPPRLPPRVPSRGMALIDKKKADTNGTNVAVPRARSFGLFSGRKQPPPGPPKPLVPKSPSLALKKTQSNIYETQRITRQPSSPLSEVMSSPAASSTTSNKSPRQTRIRQRRRQHLHNPLLRRRHSIGASTSLPSSLAASSAFTNIASHETDEAEHSTVYYPYTNRGSSSGDVESSSIHESSKSQAEQSTVDNDDDDEYDDEFREAMSSSREDSISVEPRIVISDDVTTEEEEQEEEEEEEEEEEDGEEDQCETEIDEAETETEEDHSSDFLSSGLDSASNLLCMSSRSWGEEPDIIINLPESLKSNPSTTSTKKAKEPRGDVLAHSYSKSNRSKGAVPSRIEPRIPIPTPCNNKHTSFLPIESLGKHETISENEKVSKQPRRRSVSQGPEKRHLFRNRSFGGTTRPHHKHSKDDDPVVVFDANESVAERSNAPSSPVGLGKTLSDVTGLRSSAIPPLVRRSSGCV